MSLLANQDNTISAEILDTCPIVDGLVFQYGQEECAHESWTNDLVSSFYFEFFDLNKYFSFKTTQITHEDKYISVFLENL